MSMTIISTTMTIIMSRIIVSSITMSPIWSHFMKLYTIARVIFFSIKSDICEIVPYWEKGGVHEIGEEEFIEHQHNTKWYDRILMAHDIAIVPWFSHYFLIVRSISKPCKYIPHPKDIALFDHIDSYSP